MKKVYMSWSIYHYKEDAFCAIKATTDFLGGKKSPGDVDVDWECWNLKVLFLTAFHKTRVKMNRKEWVW